MTPEQVTATKRSLNTRYLTLLSLSRNLAVEDRFPWLDHYCWVIKGYHHDSTQYPVPDDGPTALGCHELQWQLGADA